jgi:serine/threonine-protein kinase
MGHRICFVAREPRMSDTGDLYATGAYHHATPPPPAGERFAPGALLAGRYRIVAALGKGGMGEVYRADDLTLGQSVALKFLPARLARDPDRLDRFRAEVRTARQVSHPNVCRVYDIGEFDGQPFLTMEYVDGEDLASLLRRIGRLPEEKGVQLARQLCMGLAATHERGVIHRDLKPANVMIDGRGHVRLTDFGLASAAESVADVRDGTPAYQAPEQLAGREVTARSDLFALGLVLYEVFTGRPAFPAATLAELRERYADGTPSKPSSHVGGLDPAVEKVILRCLEQKPDDRPSTAYEVLAGLPGGDPLAEALAAGETPSPQLVADGGGEGTIRPGLGWALLGVVVGGIALVAFLADRVMLFRKMPLPEPPEVLARQAQQVLKHCGYPEKPADSAYHFRVNVDSLLHIFRENPSPKRWENLSAVRPAPLYFFYRQSPQPLSPTGVASDEPMGESEYMLVTEKNPPPTLPGMAGVHLDPSGRLLRMYAVPPRQSNAPDTPPQPEWDRWFDKETIGFDLASLKVSRPEWTPPCACDRQAAWVGTLTDRPDFRVTVAAAAYRGRPVYFEIMPAARPVPAKTPLRGNILLTTGLILLAALIVLAVRNVRAGRGDIRRATRLGLAIMSASAGAWLIGAHHSITHKQTQLILVLGQSGWLALVYGLIYLALEPAIRRRWPWRITGWARLLDGRWRDPMVGRDVLIGLAIGAVSLIVDRVAWLSAEWAGVPPIPITGTGPLALWVTGPPAPLWVLLAASTNVSLSVPTFLLSMSFVCFLVFRREWLAWGAVGLFSLALFTAPMLGPSPTGNALRLFWSGLILGLGLFTLARFGMLASAAALLCEIILSLVPLTADLSAWYSTQGVIGALIVTALAVYALLIATRGQGLFGEWLLGEE